MNIVQIFLIFNLLIFLCLSSTRCDEVKKRPKRYLAFNEKSKYFIRLNTKHNVIPGFRIFAQSTSFRLNFETPRRVGYNFGKLRKKMAKRDLYQGLEQLIAQNGLDGRTCIQRAVCEAAKISNKTGILLKMFRKIFTPSEEDVQDFQHLRIDECDQIENSCPLSMAHISRFTDD